MIKLITIISLLFIQTSFSATCDSTLESTPIRQEGRTKPLLVHAKESIKYIFGKTSLKYGADKLDATTAYCKLSLNQLDEEKLLFHIQHVDLRILLEFKDGQKSISLKDLRTKIQAVHSEGRRITEETSYKKSLSNLFSKYNYIMEIQSGANWIFPKSNNNSFDWISLKDYLAKSDKASFVDDLKIGSQTYTGLTGENHSLELAYEKANLPGWSLLLTLIAILLFIFVKNHKYALGFAFATTLVQIVLLTLRVFISGRAPITNMYETVLFSGLSALVLSLIFGHIKKAKIFILVGLIYNFLSLMMLMFATNMLISKIGPLVPVLRDNFWLSTHVTTIILSYGALAISWVFANTIIIKRLKNKESIINKELKSQIDMIYLCLKVGIITLAAGIILGGVWADYSWGRFWGWDPKETWSLIVLVIYMAILHGKSTSWISNERFIPLVAFAFLSVMMAWFGVNYILASGLHSYGFSEGGAIFLISFFSIQMALITIYVLKFKDKIFK